MMYASQILRSTCCWLLDVFDGCASTVVSDRQMSDVSVALLFCFLLWCCFFVSLFPVVTWMMTRQRSLLWARLPTFLVDTVCSLLCQKLIYLLRLHHPHDDRLMVDKN